MHGPASALTVVLSGFAALFLFNAARAWLKVGSATEKANERPALSVTSVRSAAATTALAMMALGLLALWLLCLSLPWELF